MDVLSDVLLAVRLTGAVFFDVDARHPFATQSPGSDAIGARVMANAQHVIGFHVVTDGTCWTEAVDRDEPPQQLDAGDMVIYPAGDANVMASAPGMRGRPDWRRYYRPVDELLPMSIRVNPDTSAERCRFVCGFLACDTRPFNPLLDSLPHVVRAPLPDRSWRWLAGLLDVAVSASSAGAARREAGVGPAGAAHGARPRSDTGTGVGAGADSRAGIPATPIVPPAAGQEAILAKLAELMFVEALRAHLSSLPPDATGWVAGLRDPCTSAALQLMHGRPAEPWTLESLAREVGTSRSVLAERFGAVVGQPPMQYLARWRLQVAARLLESGDATVRRAAAAVGYESEAAFSRAFTRYAGQPPGSWRRARRSAGAWTS
ncbi:AraC family transcriptional regulator [Cellulomonas sp. NPDC055163]